MKTKKLHYAFIILLAVSLIRGVAGPGLNASSGIFMTPVSKSLGIGVGQLSLYLSVSSVAMLLWLPAAGSIYNKYSAKYVAAAGILLQAVPYILLGFMTSVWAWYILAVPLAMGAVFLVNLLGPLLINRWFSKNIGLIMGLMMMITSLSGAVFQPVLTNLVETSGWQKTYIYFGAFALIFMLIICLSLIKNKPQEIGLKPYGMQEKQMEVKAGKEKQGVAASRALKSPAFFSLLFFMIVITGFASFQQHIATFGLGIGLNMSVIGKALSISMIGSAVGSVLIGLFSDKIGIVPTSIGVLVTGFISILLFFVGKNAVMVFIAATFLHGLATSSIGVVAPLLTIKFFGSLDYEKLFSTVMTGSPLASIVLMPAYGFIYDAFGNYNMVLFFLMSVLVIAGAGLLLGHKNSIRLNRS